MVPFYQSLDAYICATGPKAAPHPILKLPPAHTGYLNTGRFAPE
jgi:hypothetical protein